MHKISEEVFCEYRLILNYVNRVRDIAGNRLSISKLRCYHGSTVRGDDILRWLQRPLETDDISRVNFVKLLKKVGCP